MEAQKSKKFRRDLMKRLEWKIFATFGIRGFLCIKVGCTLTVRFAREIEHFHPGPGTMYLYSR